MSQKIRTSVEIDGSLKASQIANATIDTDKFLVSDGGIVKYRTGSEMLSDLGVAPGVASNIQHQVKASVAINKGQAVYVTSADGTNMVVGLASNSSESTSSKTMGLLNNTVPANGFANVVTEGLLSGLNTIGANAGDPVWLGTNGNLIYGLTNKPYAPNHLVFIGIVTRVNANNGEIFVKVQNGFELDELHDVDLKTTTPVNGHVLGYDGSLWVNKTIPGWLGYTPVPTARTITINGTTQDLSANRSWTISESDTLATVTARGASTSTQVTLSGGGNNSSTYSSLRFAGYNQGGGTGYYGFFEIENTYGSSTNQKKFFRLDSAGTIQIINSAYTNNIFNLTDAGDLTVGKIIKSGGGANEILAANGTVITAGTNITISGGVISASGSGGVTSFNTRTGAVTLTSGDVTTALGYTPADDAAVVHKAGTETITGEKTFSAIRTNISGGSLTLKSGAANRVIISSYNANEIEFGVTPAGTTYNSKFIFQSSARDYTFPNATGTVALTSDLAGFVPTSRTITINGVTQDLSANRSWTVSGGVSGSGSAGQVAFWNGASSITGESTLFWDSTNDRLGIGTDSPAQKLVVDGGSSDFTPIFAKSSLLSGGKYFGSLLAGYATTTSQSAQFGYVYDTSNIANSYAHITAYGTAEGSQFAMRANGNVQIGTTDAGYKLDVNGNTRIQTSLYVNNTDGTGTINAYSSTSVGTIIAKAQSATANFITTGVYYPRGLGMGSIVGQGNTVNIPVNNSAWSNSFGGNIGFWSDVHYGSEGGTNSVGYNAVIRGSGDSTSFGYFADLSGAVGANRYGIYTKGEAKNYFSGKVGIGITSPVYKFHVQDTSDGIVGHFSGGVSNYTLISFKSNEPNVYSTSLGSYNSGMLFRTGATNRMYITSGGNVLIGTTTTDEGYKLDVNGTNRFQGYLNGINCFEKTYQNDISFPNGTANLAADVRLGNVSFWGYIEVEITGTYSNQNSAGKLTKVFAVGTNPNNLIYINEPRVVDAIGTIPDNIAIGDFSWDATNSVYRIAISHIESSGNGYTVKVRMFTHEGGAERVFNAISFSSNYTLAALPRQYPYYNTKLGIGTTSPSAILQVNGSNSNGVIQAYVTSGGGSALRLNTNFVNNNYIDLNPYVTGVSNNGFEINQNGTQRFVISGSGNVLIGTTTDAGYKLDVNGNARVQTAIGVNAAPNTVYPVTIGCTSGANGLKIIGRSDNLGYIEFFNNNGTTVNSSLNGSTGGLQVTGATTFSSTVTATGFFNSSDIRLKEIVDYDYKVSDIKPISYLWKDSRDNKKHVGYSAQEVQKVMPDAVNEDADGMLSVNYIEVLVAKIAELENRIKQLEK